MDRALPKRLLLTLAVLAAAVLTGAGCTSATSPSSASSQASAVTSPSATPKPATVPTTTDASRPASPATSAAKPAKPKPYALPLPKPIAKIKPPKKAGTVTGPRTLPVPMLMYHAIDKTPKNAPFPDLYVSPRDFAAQLNYLTTHGYHAVTMQQVYNFWHGKGTLPTKPIVLTFDDGFSGDYETAAPLLKSVNWPATLFLIVGRKTPRMRAPMVRALIDAGWELGSHTITHEELPSETAVKMKEDVSGSRTVLRKRFGVPVNFFCYPSGKFNEQAVADVEQAGYLLATTTLPGLASPSEPYKLRRIRVSGGESIKAFGAAIER